MRLDREERIAERTEIHRRRYGLARGAAILAILGTGVTFAGKVFWTVVTENRARAERVAAAGVPIEKIRAALARVSVEHRPSFHCEVSRVRCELVDAPPDGTEVREVSLRFLGRVTNTTFADAVDALVEIWTRDAVGRTIVTADARRAGLEAEQDWDFATHPVAVPAARAADLVHIQATVSRDG